MRNQHSAERAEKQFRQKITALIGTVTHTQVLAEQALEQAGLFMDVLEMDESDTLHSLENLVCVCDETTSSLYNEYRKGGKQ